MKRSRPVYPPLTRDAIAATLARARELKPGWDSYDAAPPNEAALQWAMNLVDRLLLMEVPPVRLAPDVCGGMMYSWRRGRMDANLGYDQDSGVACGCTSDNAGDIQVWELDDTEFGIEYTLKRITSHLLTAEETP